MLTLMLERFAYTPKGTFGRMTTADSLLYTVERPWSDNRPFVSCIPEGVYIVERYVSPKFGRCWALEGGTVSVAPEPGKARNAILIHAANRADELQGCIAPGLALADFWGVSDSRAALTALDRELGGLLAWRLIITHAKPEGYHE